MSFEALSCNPFQLIDRWNSYQKENYDNSSPEANQKYLFGLSVTVFYLIITIAIAIWIFAIYSLIKYWNNISTIVAIICLILIFLPIPFGAIISIILIYATKTKIPMIQVVRI